MNRILFPGVFILISIFGIHTAGDALKEAQETVLYATIEINELMGLPNESIPSELMQNAVCIANVHLVKGGLDSARSSHGVVSCKSECRDQNSNGKGDKLDHWINPVFVELDPTSWSLPSVVDAMDLTLVFTDSRSRQLLELGTLALDDNGRLNVGPIGRSLSVDANFSVEGFVYYYSRARGHYFGVSLKNAALAMNPEFNLAVYHSQSPKEIFMSERRRVSSVIGMYVMSLEMASR